MNLVVRWFVKLTGALPSLIFFKPMVMHDGRKKSAGRAQGLCRTA